MKEIVPRLSRVAVLGSSTTPGNAQELRETELAARALGVQLQYLDVLSPKDIEVAFRAASKGRADAVLVLQSPVFVNERTQLADLAVKSRLPAIYDRREFVDDGGLMMLRDKFRRLVPPRRHLRGQDPERRQACRSPGGAANEVRAGHQSQSREADRPDDSAQCASAGG